MSQDIELTQLLKLLEEQLQNLPDERKRSNNQKYEVKDAVLAALSKSTIEVWSWCHPLRR